jgi:hypothetical protein
MDLYNQLLDKSVQVGRLLGVIGAIVKYDNPDIPNYYFKALAKTYLDVNDNEHDREQVMAQAQIRGVDIS